VKVGQRKLAVGAAALGAILGGYVFATFVPSAQTIFSPFVTGCVSLAALYFGANVAQKLKAPTEPS
jgi:hypothetical protein